MASKMTLGIRTLFKKAAEVLKQASSLREQVAIIWTVINSDAFRKFYDWYLNFIEANLLLLDPDLARELMEKRNFARFVKFMRCIGYFLKIPCEDCSPYLVECLAYHNVCHVLSPLERAECEDIRMFLQTEGHRCVGWYKKTCEERLGKLVKMFIKMPKVIDAMLTELDSVLSDNELAEKLARTWKRRVDEVRQVIGELLEVAKNMRGP